MTDRYTVPALGGIEVETPLTLHLPITHIIHEDGDVPVTRVLIPNVGPAYLPTAALTPVPPPLDEEPPVGAARMRFDVVWQRRPLGDSEWCSTTGHRLDWAALNARGPLRTVVVVEPVELPYEARDFKVTVAAMASSAFVRLESPAHLNLDSDDARTLALAVLAAAHQAEAANRHASESTKRSD